MTKIVLTLLLAVHGTVDSAENGTSGGKGSDGLEDRPTQVDPEHAAKFAASLKLFKSNVRTILTKRCLTCHGGEVIEGEFDLSSREAMLRAPAAKPAGEVGLNQPAAVIPGKAAESRLVKLIARTEQPFMPYEEEKLPEAEIAAIVKWIDLGAAYDDPLVENATAKAADWTERKVSASAKEWWAFQPLADAEPPALRQAERVRTPIDRFVLTRLEQNGLSLNAEADRRRLVRRAYFDLIGLPPTPEQIEEFVRDSSPEAYKRLIERLLANEHYGERWGRHWLDVARFAESHGFEQDYNREYAYHYRDFVIQALNRDMPYDQFVRWQLAGDEFAPDEPLALMATGFLGAGVFPTQITKNEVERTRYDALDDMAATTGTAMLGLTIGCARCHDHKFDPIPQADYYRLLATFTTTVRSNIDLDLSPEVHRRELAAWEKEHAPLADELAKFEKDQLPERFEQWLATRLRREAANSTAAKWIVLDLVEYRSAGNATLKKLDDGSLLASGENPKFDTYTFTARTDLKGIRGIRLEALADPSFPNQGPGRAANGNFALTDFRVSAKPAAAAGSKPASPASGEGADTALKLLNPRATFEQNGLPVKAAVDGDAKSAWAVDPEFGKTHAAAFDVEADAGFDGGTILTLTLKFENNDGHNIGRPRLSIAAAAGLELPGESQPQPLVELETILADVKEQPTEQQRASLWRWYRTVDDEWRKRHQAVGDHLANKPQPTLTKVMVTSEGFTPLRHHTQGADFFEETFFLRRGECEKKVKPAGQSFLQVLMDSSEGSERWIEQPPDGWRTSYRRRSLANWMTDTEHGAGHLLARVIVNRLWQHHFGRAIVGTPNDFGRQGERPSHPELLDWLAGELIRNGWRLKPMHELMMTSAVYMQTSGYDASKSAADPDNRLHWRRDPSRLEAEVIRDSMLAISGVLDPTMFGPGTLEEEHTRRSIYFTIKRSKLIPMMQLFDSPEPLVSVGQRPSTTVAPQALMFMNNPNVRKYARGFAGRLRPAAANSLADAVRFGYLAATGREPNELELAESVKFIESQIASYRPSGKTEATALALADFCQVLMSLNEFVYIE